MSRPIHFEILSDNPESIHKFYSEVFGWEVASMGGGEQGYWFARTGDEATQGIHGAFMHRHFPQPVINTIQVVSLADTLVAIEANGGKKVHGPNEIPNVGHHAYCSDPDGTLFGILEPAAK